MGYYCRRYRFGQPDVTTEESKKGWNAVMTVAGRKIGMGSALNKKGAQHQCYLDVVRYLDECDPELWQSFLKQEVSICPVPSSSDISHMTVQLCIAALGLLLSRTCTLGLAEAV